MTHIATARALANLLLACSLLALSMAALPCSAGAQQPTGAGTTKAPSVQATTPAPTAPPTPPPAPLVSKAPLAQFSWLVGHWQGEWGPRVAQQVWMPPRSGEMVGIFQLSEDSHTLVVEVYAIRATPRGIELRVRHFTPALTPWEKAGPAVLNLTSIDAKSILFENADNGQPKHWLMKRTGTDSFLARFEIVPKDGQQQVAEISFHRETVAPPARH
jgi:hypothetical protein